MEITTLSSAKRKATSYWYDKLVEAEDYLTIGGELYLDDWEFITPLIANKTEVSARKIKEPFYWYIKPSKTEGYFLIAYKPYLNDTKFIRSLIANTEELRHSLNYTYEIQATKAVESLLERVRSYLTDLESPYIQNKESKDTLKLILNDELIIELPYQFESLYNSIEESKYILELEENWDGEGSPTYKQSTWRRAIEFISNYAIWIFSETNRIIDAPKIYHGPNGSIDILWKKENYRLLINIPDDAEKPASFYGDDYK
ncbi:MAG: hypothetical protein ACRENZ_02725, partial [Thermodesulfobacteriota bacterium]